MTVRLDELTWAEMADVLDSDPDVVITVPTTLGIMGDAAAGDAETGKRVVEHFVSNPRRVIEDVWAAQVPPRLR